MNPGGRSPGLSIGGGMIDFIFSWEFIVGAIVGGAIFYGLAVYAVGQILSSLWRR